jgi:hypothetical protein
VKYFISHSEKNEMLINKFVDFLVLGMNINYQDIFCSLTGDIDVSEDFTNSIKENMLSSDVVSLCNITRISS